MSTQRKLFEQVYRQIYDNGTLCYDVLYDSRSYKGFIHNLPAPHTIYFSKIADFKSTLIKMVIDDVYKHEGLRLPLFRFAVVELFDDRIKLHVRTYTSNPYEIALF